MTRFHAALVQVVLSSGSILVMNGAALAGKIIGNGLPNTGRRAFERAIRHFKKCRCANHPG